MTLSRMLPKHESDWIGYSDVRRNALKPFFQYFPRLALELVCTPDEDGTLYRASHLVSNPYSERREAALSLVPIKELIDWCNEEPETRYAFAAGSCTLFEKQDDDKAPLVISETAVKLLEAAPDKNAVLKTYISRFRPSAWSGSRADILQARLPLLDQLIISDDEAISSAIQSAKKTLQQWTDAERAEETEEEKSRNSSFE